MTALRYNHPLDLLPTIKDSRPRPHLPVSTRKPFKSEIALTLLLFTDGAYVSELKKPPVSSADPLRCLRHLAASNLFTFERFVTSEAALGEFLFIPQEAKQRARLEVNRRRAERNADAIDWLYVEQGKCQLFPHFCALFGIKVLG